MFKGQTQLFSSHLVEKNLFFSSNRGLLNSTVCLWPCTLSLHLVLVPNWAAKWLCQVWENLYFQPRVHHNHVLWWSRNNSGGLQWPLSQSIYNQWMLVRLKVDNGSSFSQLQQQWGDKYRGAASVGGRWGILTERLPLNTQQQNMQSLPNHRGPSRLIRVLLFPKLELLGRTVSNRYSWDSLIMALTPNIAVLNLKHLCHKQPGRKRCLQTRSSKLLEPFLLVNLANYFFKCWDAMIERTTDLPHSRHFEL